jgi:hypothetical protein
MTRSAVQTGVESLVDDVARATAEEFSVVRALRDNGPVAELGGGVADELAESEQFRERVVYPEIDEFRDGVLDLFDVLLDCAASQTPVEERADAVLAHDPYYQHLRADVSASRREEVREGLLEYHRSVADALSPLVESDADGFWVAVADAYTESEAVAFVDQAFVFAEPAERFRADIVFQTELDLSEFLSGGVGLLAASLPSPTVEFTDEAVRAIGRGEARVVEETKREVRRQFDGEG